HVHVDSASTLLGKASPRLNTIISVLVAAGGFKRQSVLGNRFWPMPRHRMRVIGSTLTSGLVVWRKICSVMISTHSITSSKSSFAHPRSFQRWSCYVFWLEGRFVPQCYFY